MNELTPPGDIIHSRDDHRKQRVSPLHTNLALDLRRKSREFSPVRDLVTIPAKF